MDTTVKAINSGKLFGLFGFQESLEEKINELTESEDSNSRLREEILELVTKFGKERDEVEKRLEKYRKESQHQKELIKEKSQRILVLETDHEDFQKLLEKKDKEIRKMKKVILKLMEDLEEFRHIDERCFTIAKILEHIDNID